MKPFRACCSYLWLSVLLLGMISGCGQRPRENPLLDLGSVKDFTLTERSEKKVGLSDLQGKVWIASFIFTRCTGPCPQISGTMARLQKDLSNEPDRVRLVTFTVAARDDTPRELRRYADSFQADPNRWLFLTGDEGTIHKLIRESFLLPVERVAGEKVKTGAEVEHSTRLVLVDTRGHIRGFFQGMILQDASEPDREFETNLTKLQAAVAALLREQS